MEAERAATVEAFRRLARSEHRLVWAVSQVHRVRDGPGGVRGATCLPGGD